ncbi:MAG: sugar phosphate nucleotidyltransferase [Candidatus Fimenecus sp.]
MNKEQFSVLTALEKNANLSAKELSQKTGIQSAALSDILAELQDLGYWKDGAVTQKGLEALEPYRVKRAIFIAAGMGSRMMPLTLSCPKPLVRVNGVRIIDTLIDACIAADVEEIIIVRGYLGECFNQLTDKYPNIKFVDNPHYKEYNNISSAYLVKDLIGGSYIFESDIYLVNRDLITKYQYESNYLGVPCEETPDWSFDTDENLKITDLHKPGKNCHHMFGISYYDKPTGALFEKYVEEVFNNMLGGKDHFWDDVLCHFYVDKANIHVRECSFRDIMEIDSFDELCEIDEQYRITNL